MNYYFALIRKSEFTDLFKYGKLCLNPNFIITIDNDISKTPINSSLFDPWINQNFSFEYSWEYLVIYYGKDTTNEKNEEVNIENILKVFPLDNDAKQQIELSFDHRIKIEQPICEDVINKLRNQQEYINSKQGVDNIWSIFQIPYDKDLYNNVITDRILFEFASSLDSKPNGELSYWTYLMRYKRHAFYPQETIGYFMDVVHVLCNYKQKQEVWDEDVEQTSIMQLLREDPFNNETKVPDMIEKLEVEEKAANILSVLNKLENQVNVLQTSVLFLMILDKYRENGITHTERDHNFINNGIERCKNDFLLALYMLGVVLGHKKTYDCLYETLPLSCFKKTEQIQREAELLRQEQERVRYEQEQEDLQKAYANKQKRPKQGRAAYLTNNQGKGKKDKSETTTPNYTTYSSSMNNQESLTEVVAAPKKQKNVSKKTPESKKQKKQTDTQTSMFNENK